MKSMGLPAPASVSSSLDPTAVQLWALASEVGQQLLTDYIWQFLDAEFTITTVIGTPNYALPADWGGFTPDASWNRTTRMPLSGQILDHEWQAMKAISSVGTLFSVLYRIENNEVVFYNSPTAVQTIIMPYTSRGWVKTIAGTRRDNLTADDDTVLYDSQLFKERLKLKWREEKGFDTTRQQEIADDCLESAQGMDSPGRTLSLVPRSGIQYLSIFNIPNTGIGS